MDFHDREELERGVLHAPCQLCTGPGSKPRELDLTQVIRCAGAALYASEKVIVRTTFEAWCQLCASDAAKPRELAQTTP